MSEKIADTGGPLWVDLGCGMAKSDGFVGIDRTPMPGVDLIADMDGVLPLHSDSVDLLFASHSLEHARDIVHTMREVFRVCKHGAQVCILAPYSEQKLNVANPYHLNAFNEHTPRFWTNCAGANIDVKEYWHPHAQGWGLAASDNSAPGMDFRLARMEFFYFPEYLALPDHERIEARRRYIDVCDQVLYHLVVWKDASASEEDLESIIQNMEYFDPPLIVTRRAEEASMRRAGLSSTGGAEHSLASLVNPESRRNREHIVRLDERLTTLNAMLSEVELTRKEMEKERESAGALRGDLHAARTKAVELEQLIEHQRTQLELFSKRVQQAENAVVRAENALKEQGALLQQAWIEAISSAHENALHRRRKLARLADLMSNKSSIRAHLPPSFGLLLDQWAADVVIQLGQDLQAQDFSVYLMKTPPHKPTAIEIGLLGTVSNLGERAGVEIATEGQRIVCQTEMEIDGRASGPLHFPIDLGDVSPLRTVEVRIFSSTKFAPLYVLEARTSRLKRPGQVLARWI